jgi:hypothetical protein
MERDFPAHVHGDKGNLGAAYHGSLMLCVIKDMSSGFRDRNFRSQIVWAV